MTKAVIFDMDGIVVDTVPIHFKAWKRMFNEYGKEFDFQDYKEKVDGIPRMDGARAVLTELSEKELEEAAAKKQGYFRDILDKDEIPIHASTVELIKKLHEERIPQAVISSSKNCVYILKKIGVYDLLDSVVDGSAITKGKPDPQIFLMAAENIGADPSGCVVFEDAILGVKAAKNGGMFAVGVDRYDAPERLAEADIIVKDIGELSFQQIMEFV